MKTETKTKNYLAWAVRTLFTTMLAMTAQTVQADDMTWADLKTAVEAGGTVTLTNDVTRNASQRISVTGEATVNLNGHTIYGYETGSSTHYNNDPIFVVTDGGRLTVTDGSTGGMLTNLWGASAIEVYGTDESNYGEATLAAGTIASGGVGASGYGRITMTGGTINTNDNKGVNIYNNGRFTMTGGSITGNSIGVNISSASATFTVSGDVNITGNTEKNVRLYYRNDNFTPIHIGGELASTARIGVWTDQNADGINGKVITDGLPGNGSMANFVISGRTDIVLTIDGSGELIFAKPCSLTIPEGITATYDGIDYTNQTIGILSGATVSLSCEGSVESGKSIRYMAAYGDITYPGAANADGRRATLTMPNCDVTLSMGTPNDFTIPGGISLKEAFWEGTSYGLSAIIDGSSVETISIPSPITVTGITYDRAFTLGKAATVMLPFDYKCFGEVYDGGKFYSFAGVEQSGTQWIATMKEVGDDANNATTLTANTPYLFMPTKDTKMHLIIYDQNAEHQVTLCTEGGGNQQTADAGSHWTFKGTYAYKEWIAEGANSEEIGRAYGFAGVAKDGISVGDFVRVASGAKIRPMSCYLLWSDTPNAARTLTRGAAGADELPQSITVRLVSSVGETTAIGTLDTQTGELDFEGGGWYDMSGRRLNGKPSQKGMYINNGKKVIVK